MEAIGRQPRPSAVPPSSPFAQAAAASAGSIAISVYLADVGKPVKPQPVRMGKIYTAPKKAVLGFMSCYREPNYFQLELNPLLADKPKTEPFLTLGRIEPSDQDNQNNPHLMNGCAFDFTFTAEFYTAGTRPERIDTFRGVCIVKEFVVSLISLTDRVWRRPSIVHPSLLSTLSQMHRWIFGAFAELIHNSFEADCTEIKINMVEQSESSEVPGTITIFDNGKGMDPQELHQMMTFGKPATLQETKVGRYGVGFKTGSMRIGGSVVVCTKRKGDNYASVGFYSKIAGSSENLEAQIVVLDSLGKLVSVYSNGTELQTILKSIRVALCTDSDMIFYQKIFQSFTKDEAFTKVVIIKPTSELWTGHYARGRDDVMRDNMVDEDIVLKQTRVNAHDHFKRRVLGYVPSLNQSVLASEADGLKFQWSLRAYCEIMFYEKPKFRLFIQNKEVALDSVEKRLFLDKQVRLSLPSETTGQEPWPVIAGRSEEFESQKLAGLYLYWNNCLIQPLWFPIPGGVPTEQHFGMVGAVQLKLNPANNKQEFDPTDPKFEAIMEALQNVFETDLANALDGESSNKTDASTHWIQCSSCSMWYATKSEISNHNFTCATLGCICGEIMDYITDNGFKGSRSVPIKSEVKKLPAKQSDSSSVTVVSVEVKPAEFQIDASQPLGTIEPSQQAHATVFKGSWGGHAVAVKRLDKRSLTASGVDPGRALVRGVQPLLKLRHPAIVQVYFVCLENHSFGMEYFPNGQTLADYLSAEVPSFFQTKAIASMLASAVTYLHSQKVIHNDLHSRNILVIQDPSSAEGVQIKLIDFGISVFQSGTPQRRSESTQRLVSQGVPRYSPPEKLRASEGDFDPSEKADVYALGCLIGLIVTGKEPWSGIPDSLMLPRMLESKDPYGTLLADVKTRFKTFKNRSIEANHFWESLHRILSSCWRLTPKERSNASEVSQFFVDMQAKLSVTAIDRLTMHYGTSVVYHVIECEESFADLKKFECLRSPATRNGINKAISSNITVAEHIRYYSTVADKSPFISLTADPLWALWYAITEKLYKDNSESKKTSYLLEIDLAKVKSFYDMCSGEGRAAALKLNNSENFGPGVMVLNYATSASEIIIDSDIPKEAIVQGGCRVLKKGLQNQPLWAALVNMKYNTVAGKPSYKDFVTAFRSNFPSTQVLDIIDAMPIKPWAKIKAPSESKPSPSPSKRSASKALGDDDDEDPDVPAPKKPRTGKEQNVSPIQVIELSQ